MKKCTKCGVVQPLDNFYKAGGTRDGHRGDCKACFQKRAKARYPLVREIAIERAKQWARENPARLRETKRRYAESGRKAAADRRSHLKRKFGLTVEQYDAMLAAQGGVCAICGRPPRDDISLHVDHDHETGQVRGLIDFRCNNALGDFDDDAARLAAAIRYLDRHDPETQRLTQQIKQRAHALITTR